MPGRQRHLRFTLRWPKLQTGSPNGCLKLDSQANFWWANHKIPCSFCNFRVVENAGFAKLETQFSCFKTCLVWVSSVFPVLSCHASLLSIVWWSKLAVRETYILRSMNQVSWMGSQKIFLGRSLVKITPSTKWILCHTIYITQVSIFHLFLAVIGILI